MKDRTALNVVLFSCLVISKLLASINEPATVVKVINQMTTNN
jgi:hypothetical protein